MSDNRFKISNTPEPDVADMDFKQLRNKVQSLIDEMARMKRYYEDSINNLDSSNFGKSFAIQQNNMKATIKMAADVIKTAVTEDDLAQELTKYSTIEQTAEAITSTVTAEYVNTLIGGGYVTNAMMMSQIQQTSEQILLSVSTEYETKENAETQYNSLTSSIALTSEQIQSKVSKTDLETELSDYSTITQTASDISAAVSAERSYVTNLLDTDYYTQEEIDSKISVSADGVLIEVSGVYQTIDAADDDYSYLNGRINTTNSNVSSLRSSVNVNADEISAIVSGDYTDSMLEGYLTGIVISPNSIKMVDDSVYSVYNSEGLRFYDSADQVEGWAIEPSASYGGVLNYYINDGNCYRFGTGESGTGYAYTDMSIKAINSQRGRFVVDVTNSSNREVKFVGLNYSSSNAPYIYANEKLLATQEWVLANAGSGGSGTVVAVFG